ncbi:MULTISPECIES: pyrimidine dimer DNA glycosylase/endonuclease V [Methylococcus]|uniref:Pyrimidine dimer DNA glycosylase/endonuclease V n=1 Tax=Methylococcus capsulatus TaxID=414 RepID=A0ABZ2F0Y0_METCP|nr:MULTISPECIES: pyrimidine dimer DNA glycosylase/endonuclease V [Methylococcus]MDF9391396.1 DNA lyase [Methylococcus capsulatus]
MRLWTLHPRYLDAKGLVALWREALLAQAVLKGLTRGYTRHPQLIRFRQTPAPEAAIAHYLRAVHAEAGRRGYRFDAGKIAPAPQPALMAATDGQIAYEWAHLKAKLKARAPAWLEILETVSIPEPHPSFRLVPGPVADWESLPGTLAR